MKVFEAIEQLQEYGADDELTITKIQKVGGWRFEWSEAGVEASCTSCGQTFWFDPFEGYNHNWFRKTHPYCHMCGAKMEVE